MRVTRLFFVRKGVEKNGEDKKSHLKFRKNNIQRVVGSLEISEDDTKSGDKDVCVKCYRTVEMVLKMETNINKTGTRTRSITLATLIVNIPSPRKHQIQISY